jgi:hypothetical protein
MTPFRLWTWTLFCILYNQHCRTEFCNVGGLDSCVKDHEHKPDSEVSVTFLNPLEGSNVWVDPAARDEGGVYMPVQIKTGGLNKTNQNFLVLYLNGQAVHNQSVEDGILDLQIRIPQRYGGDRFYNSLMKMDLSIGDEECGFSRYLEAAIISSPEIMTPRSERANFISSDYVRFSLGCEDAQYVDQRVSESRAQVASARTLPTS